MKNIRPADASPLNSIATLIAATFLLTACGIFSGGGNSRDDGTTGWKVWVKTSPCAGGRTDWISVAKTNPTEGGGGSFWQTADLIVVSTPCTKDNTCTFTQAEAAANSVRASNAFTNYCCRDFSVWRNSSTGAMSVVVGKYSTGGFGWVLEKADLCCEEAESLAGISGACSGSSQAPPLGPPTVRRTPVNSNTTTVGNTGGTNYNGSGEIVTATPYTTTPYPTQPPPPISGRWILVSTTVTPDPPAQGGGNKWSYGAQSSSARYEVYNGTAFDFQWTRPPQQIDENGFTVSLNIQCQPRNEPGCSGVFGVAGSGIESDTPRGQWVAEANGRNGAPGSGQKSITFKPSPNAGDIEVEIGLMWGAVRFVYKYQRAQ